jgi:hypothetical protein
MRRGLILSLLVAVSGSGCMTPAGQTKGLCSPATTSSTNQFVINCTAIGQEQGQKMVALLNKVLAKQLDPNVVMAKLDEISSGVQNIPRRTGDRVLSESQQAALGRLLHKSPESVSVVLIGDREANDYGQQIVQVMKSSGWNVTLYYIGSLSPPRYGIRVNGNDALLGAFTAVGIDASNGKVPMDANVFIGLNRRLN